MGDRQSKAPKSGLDLTRTEDREHDAYRGVEEHEAVRSGTKKPILLRVKGSSEVVSVSKGQSWSDARRERWEKEAGEGEEG